MSFDGAKIHITAITAKSLQGLQREILLPSD